MDSVASYTIALLFALLVHGVLVALIGVNWSDETIAVTDIQPYYIDATVVEQNPYKAKRQQEVDKQQRKIQQRRIEETEINRQQQNWEVEQHRKEQQAAMPEPVIEVEPQLEPEVVQTDDPVDEEELGSAFEKELSLALLGEQNARKAVTDDEKAMAYVVQIQREIIQNWSRPPSARNGMQTILRVHLVPTGEVVDVNIEESSGNSAFDRSAIQAVRKSGRFVVPGDALRFERDFRVFTVLFRPDDLRL